MFDKIISLVSGKYDAYTIEETGNKVIYTLVSNDRSDFECIKTKLRDVVGTTVYTDENEIYNIETSDDLGFNRIVFVKKISSNR
ncbi:MAG: hypothetical protein HGA49_03380 [Eubacteriaceae bacterium]|nr:hypothetical protein [Eubacteriaceae bacterium]